MKRFEKTIENKKGNIITNNIIIYKLISLLPDNLKNIISDIIVVKVSIADNAAAVP